MQEVDTYVLTNFVRVLHVSACFTYTFSRTYECVFTHTFKFQICTCVFFTRGICMPLYVYIRIRVHHTHTHTHTHTHVHARGVGMNTRARNANKKGHTHEVNPRPRNREEERRILVSGLERTREKRERVSLASEAIGEPL